MKVVMIPWLAHGHITPFLELAKKLAKRNCQIYLCSTPINLTSIKKRNTDLEDYSDSITLVEFHLPSSAQLPPHYHTTNGLPSHLSGTLRTALDTAGPNLISNILKNLTPDLVIYDIIQPWVQTVAMSSNIPAVGFMTSGAAPACHCLNFPQQPSLNLPFQAMQLQEFHARKFREIFGAPHFGEHLKDVLQKSFKIALFNTFSGLEGKYIDSLTDFLNKKIVPVGPLVQEVAMDDTEEEANILKWLGEKEESSTVFISFGSEGFLTKQEMEEIAHGLELSKVNFIWVVRFPPGQENKTSIQEALPEGFLQRVGDRGLVVEGWAPQAKILAHPSTGGFVSHCGWNSTMESLKFGVPVIAVPMHLDQPFNAKLLEEVGAGVDVKREDDGRLDREDIAKVISKVVLGKSGEEIKFKAREFSQSIRLEGEGKYDELVQELAHLTRQQT